LRYGAFALNDDRSTPDIRPSDALFDGRLALHQLPRGSYRTNVDALLLAAFAAEAHGENPARVVYDLGAGVGAVGLSLLFFERATRVVFVEIDAKAAALSAENISANGWSARAEAITADVRDVALTRNAVADLVVCNPPFFAPGRGRPAQTPSRAVARGGELAHFVMAARTLLGRRGRACFVYPALELVTLATTLRAAGLEPKRARFVHATSAAAARIVLVEAVAGKAGGLRIAPPVVERSGSGYSQELATLLAGTLPGLRSP
jgi:tRNA1Val (adenine37-N6)-methyltransferase